MTKHVQARYLNSNLNTKMEKLRIQDWLDPTTKLFLLLDDDNKILTLDEPEESKETHALP